MPPTASAQRMLNSTRKRLGQAGDDTHHDDERNTVTKTLVRNLLTEPHDEHGAGGKYHYRADLEQEVVGPEDECLARELVVKIGDIGRTLQQEHDDGKVPCPLVHFAASTLPLALHPLEIGYHHTHQLHDDGGGDVGHHAQCEYRRVGESTAGEDIQQAEQTGPRHLVGERRQCIGIDTGNHHKTTEPIYKKKAQSIEYSLLQFLYLKYVLECLDKFLHGRRNIRVLQRSLPWPLWPPRHSC